jgi:hypothetical protein
VVAIAGLVLYYNHLAEKKRSEQWKQAADELGFTFTEQPGTRPLDTLAGFHLFSQGHSKKVRNQLRGEAGGLEVLLFDYRFTVGSGKHSHTHQQTVLCFQLAGVSLPKFTLRPENFLHKIGKLFGYQDINFDSHPAFSKKYLLRGTDEAAIRELFTEEILAYYESRDGVSTEGNGDHLLFYRADKRISPEKVRAFLEEGFEVKALFQR